MISKENNLALVSCIMPTYNRRKFVPHAINYFLRQDYSNKELIIIDDGTDSIKDLVPDEPSIHYYQLDKKITVGAKLNMACEYAQGNIIANWDDDDWYAPRRLSYQVKILNNVNAEVCGLNTLLYFDVNKKTGYKYIYPSNLRIWLLGSSLCYKRELWLKNKFADINVGMDGLFVWAIQQEKIKVLEDFTFSVYMIHDHNVSPKKTNGSWWHPYPVKDLASLVNGDWHIYSNVNLYNSKSTIKVQYRTESNAYATAIARSSIKNIFACLVHENEDCILDLVRNLHFLDPNSIILLYNGGENPDLLHNKCLLEKFGAVIHPNPHPVKHGYLHDFALQCMQFALDNLMFDTITIVDSDQVLVRSGYSNYIGDFLHKHPKAGMLSSKPEKVRNDDKTNYVALQAFKEYELWKPLLQSFPGGADKFVYWTFWPSTVFTSNVVLDLVKLFQENELLKEIMKQTKIWATEEVIFPTLVTLLGYEIKLNPCSNNYVKYKVSYDINDTRLALNTPTVYWIHPVERKYEDSIRKHIRQNFNCYLQTCNYNFQANNNASHMLLISSVINHVKEIEGWLSESEIDLLIATAIKTCIDLPKFQNIVEIGSYHGKSTVALGKVVKSLFPGAKVFAIDPHTGTVGASDQGLETLPSSLQMFKRNIESEGLLETVELIQDYSYNVKWMKPIHMIFVDGLHDYLNVARDFWNFSTWIVPHGYIAFHDYAYYYPGVQTFVNELLQTNEYQFVQLEDSLIVLQKK